MSFEFNNPLLYELREDFVSKENLCVISNTSKIILDELPNEFYGVTAVLIGTAQAGASSTITLTSGASTTDDRYNNFTITIIGGTGLGQSKLITDYVGSTKVATISGTWAINPDNTSIYSIACYNESKIITGLSINSFYVNYLNSIITFNSSEIGQTVSASYQGRGVILLSADRVYTKSVDGNATQNLQEVSDSVGNSSTVLANLTATIGNGTTKIDAINVAIGNGTTKISEIGTAISNADIKKGEVNTAISNGTIKISEIQSKITEASGHEITLGGMNSSADNYYTNLLPARITEANNTKNALDDMNDIALVTKEALESSEIVASESTRVIAENFRIENETVRISSETIRNSSENIRLNNEVNRISGELQRVNSEAIRGSNESARVSSEAVRLTSEVTRISNESNRQSTYTNYNNSVNTTQLIWKTPVANFAALASTYPTPLSGWCAQTLDNNQWYRYSGSLWEYKGNFSITGAATTVDLTAIDVAKASMIRNLRHSGVVNYLPITTGSTTNLNSITIPETTYSVNGYEITMPLTVVTLPTPPTTGTWDDLIFLESWFPSNGNGYVQSARYRTVSNVNFMLYPEGFHTKTLSTAEINFSTVVTAQGGNALPLTGDTTSQTIRGRILFSPKIIRGANSSFPAIALDDEGLYVAGIGDATSKSTLQTYDGYSYAIPLFRIKRRNSSGFSAGNFNGARNYVNPAINRSVSTADGVGTITLLTQADYDYIQVSDTFVYITNADTRFKITSKNGSLTCGVYWYTYSTGVPLVVSAVSNLTAYALKSDRPDSLYANVIDIRDIPPSYDLRHRVQAQFNYDYELKKGSDQFMRGELSPLKMIKTYHGIPKTEIDINTVFYASLDGSLVPEVGTLTSSTAVTYKPCPTGSGANFANTQNAVYPISLVGDFTVGVLLNKSDLLVTSLNANYIWALGGTSIILALRKVNSGGLALFDGITGIPLSPTLTVSLATLQAMSSNVIQVRVRYVASTHTLYMTINGAIANSITSYTIVSADITYVRLGNSASGFTHIGTISDISISNIDRGSLFPNLPADFISGDAQIMPAFTNQRHVLSQAQMTHTLNGIAKIGTIGSSRGLATSRTSGSWTSADTVTVTGVAGELISGVFDTDTASATIVKDEIIGSTSLTLDVVATILSVNDTFQILDRVAGTLRTTVHTISAIDTTTKIITITPGLVGAVSKYQSLIMETTATSSVPKVTYALTGTAQAGASTTITLASTASAVDDFYNGLTVYITDHTGIGQSRTITDYVGSTKVATVSAWSVNPDATSDYAIYGIVAVGTWTNIGTNVATLTLGINLMLTTQDLQIDYSTIMPSGQNALSVLTTATLGGEAGIKVPYANQTITSDYSAKVSGQTWGNPNIAKTLSGIVANNPAPTDFLTELITSEYAKMFTLDGISTTFQTSVNGEQAIRIHQLDMIKNIERKLGCKIPANTTALKVAWIKSNVSKLTPKLNCSGSSPIGNKATVAIRDNNSNTWTVGGNHTNAEITLISYDITSASTVTLTNAIDANGILNVISYGEVSDGVTASVINNDYVSLDIVFASNVVNSMGLSTGTSSSIVLTDDFASKLKGDVTSNPNIIRYKEGTIASRNTEFVPGTGTEIESTTGNSNYSVLSSLNATLASYTTSISGKGAGYIISWNAVSEFEQKYGSINAIDKVAYLKANLGTIVGNCWAMGLLASGGNSATLAVWNSVAQTWSTSGTVNTTNAIVKIIGGSFTVSIANMIDSSGFVHFLIYSSASDTTASTVFVDYCNIELTLASGIYLSGYDILSPSNPRRDGGLSNIMVINKSTKEVQSLFNWSNEYTLTTFSDYYEAPPAIPATTDVTILAEIPEWQIVDISSACGQKEGIHPWKSLAYRVGYDRDELYGEIGISNLPFSSDCVNVNTSSKVSVNGTGFLANYTKQYGLTAISKPLVGIARWLCMYNSQLYLLVLSKYKMDGSFTVDGVGSCYLIPVSGKCLVKTEEGIVRSGVVTPTVWKSNPLVVEGFVSKDTNKLITS